MDTKLSARPLGASAFLYKRCTVEPGTFIPCVDVSDVFRNISANTADVAVANESSGEVLILQVGYNNLLKYQQC